MFIVSSAMPRRALRAAAFPHAFAAVPGCAATPRTDAVRVPPLDVVETENSYTATLEMPGISKEQFSIAIEGRRVDVSTRAVPRSETAADAQPSARSAPHYARSFVLPDELEATSAEARLDNGVLTLTLPKRAANRATRISVQ